MNIHRRVGGTNKHEETNNKNASPYKLKLSQKSKSHATKISVFFTSLSAIMIYILYYSTLVMSIHSKNTKQIEIDVPDIGAARSKVSSNWHAHPDFSEGGIVLFFHIPKTGGSSIRTMAKRDDRTEWYGNDKLEMSEIKKQITEWTNTSKDGIVGPGKKVKFMEFHWKLESPVSMINDLVKWRENAQRNNIPFFNFMIMRDPLDAYLSIYNYFCIFLQKNKSVKCPPPHTVDSMIAYSPDNPQSRWLCHATTLKLNEENGEFTSKDIHECGDVLMDLVKLEFDWVGNMRELSDTVTLFNSMGIPFESINKNNPKGFKKIERKDLNETAVKILRSKLSLDQQLMDYVDQFFTLDKFGMGTAGNT